MLLAQIAANPASTNQQPTILMEAAGWVALGFLALLGAAVLWYIFSERIDLRKLISEPNGDASLSRFQLLIFTFIIAASLFLIVAAPNPPKFPDEIPQGVLVLLGISSSSYLVSKGIQFSREEGVTETDPEVKVSPTTATTTAGGNSVQFKSDVLRLTATTVAWTVEPANGMGTVNANGLYTPPAVVAGGLRPTGTAMVRATSTADPSLSDVATVTIT